MVIKLIKNLRGIIKKAKGCMNKYLWCKYQSTEEICNNGSGSPITKPNKKTQSFTASLSSFLVCVPILPIPEYLRCFSNHSQAEYIPESNSSHSKNSLSKSHSFICC